MGGEGSGGVRSGTPGRAYSNRTDLNTKNVPITAAKSQPYGVAGAQRAAQSVVPLATPQPSQPAQPGRPGAPTGQPAPSLTARSGPPLDAPTARPDEPVTAGLPIGAGPGPESVFAPMSDATSIELRSLYALYPNNDLLSLIEEMDAGRSY